MQCILCYSVSEYSIAKEEFSELLIYFVRVSVPKLIFIYVTLSLRKSSVQ